MLFGFITLRDLCAFLLGSFSVSLVFLFIYLIARFLVFLSSVFHRDYCKRGGMRLDCSESFPADEDEDEDEYEDEGEADFYL